jgi:protein-disulfide isomerase
MSSDETGQTPASGPAADPREDDSRGRREAVREKAQQVKARQSRNRVLRRSAIVLAVVAAVAAIAFAVTSVVVPTMTAPTQNPTGLVEDGVLVDQAMLQAGEGDAEDAEEPEETPAPEETPGAEPIEIHVYVDYLSQAAGDFQRVNQAQLTQWVEQGAVELVYHPVALLTSKSNGTKYSQRAAGAAACVFEHAPEAFPAFNHELLTNQPAVDSDGYADSELADRAIATGAEDTKTVRACIEDEDYFAWAREATERALNEPLPGTDGVTLTGAPMIVVNGEPYVGSLDKPEEFAAFLLAVDSEAYLETAAPEEPEGE